jgi:hypothetical protein
VRGLSEGVEEDGTVEGSHKDDFAQGCAMSGTVSGRSSLIGDARAHVLLDLYILYKLVDRSASSTPCLYTRLFSPLCSYRIRAALG